jgi:hypothetical protein
MEYRFMTSKQLPVANPFPDNPVVSDTIEGLPDYDTKSFIAAREKLDIYVEDFQAPKKKLSGLVLGIRGRVGSGKTYVVFQLMEHARKKPLATKTIYAKADKIDILDIYVNHFARALKFDDLRDLISLHLAKLLRTQTTEPSDEMSAVDGQRSLLELAQQEVDKLVKDNPQEILRLVQQDLLPVSNLQRDLNNEIEATPQGPTNDFFLAYSRLTDKDFGPLAVRWLKGEKLSPSEQRDLGLKAAQINTPVQALDAFRFLLSAFRKADYAIMFCLDEFERFGVPGEPQVIKQLGALLKDLAEVFKGTGQILVIAGVNEAWSSLTRDVFARVRRTDMVTITLEKGEASGLLNAYCAPRNSLTDLFDEDAVAMLSEASRRNARQLLTLAHHAFADTLAADALSAGSEFPITSNRIEQSLTKMLGGQQRLDVVLQSIRDVATELALAVQQEDVADGVRYKISLGDSLRPSAVLLIAESIFKLGEVAAATTVNEISHNLRQRSERTRVCVIIVGYSTAEIRDDLEKVVDRVFLFGDEAFANELRDFLKATPLKDSEVEQKIQAQDAAYRELLQKFDTYEVSRRDELAQLTKALAAVQLQVNRAGDAVREKRIKDKMEETLAEIKSLLQQEEDLLLRLSPPEGGINREAVVAAYTQANSLLEDQRGNIKRASILNEKMLQAEKFAALLEVARVQIERAAETWREIYRRSNITDASSIPDLLRMLEIARQLIFERRRTLTDLELLHLQRLPSDTGGVFSRITTALGRVSLITAILLAVFGLGLIFGYRSLSSDWDKETKVLQSYATTLNDIQNVATRLELWDDIRDDQSRSTLSNDLVKSVIALRESESDMRSLKYTPLPFSSNQNTEKWLLDAKGFLSLAPPAASDAPPAPDFRSSTEREYDYRLALSRYKQNLNELKSAAGAVIKDCTNRRAFINSLTFSAFAWQFILLNKTLTAIIFFPLLALLYWRLSERLNAWRLRRGRMGTVTPAS